MACNLGYRFDVADADVTCQNFYFEPQVGVEYKKFSLTAGFTFNSAKYKEEDNWEPPTKDSWSANSLNLRLGYRF